jgi:hypothetical protein
MSIDEDALVVIAKKADGSMRDSQSIFDQVTAFCGPNITYQQANEALNLIDQEFFFRVTDMMRTHDTAEAFTVVEHIMRTGYDPQEFLIGLAEHLRNYLSVLTTGSPRLIEAAKAHKDRYGEEARSMEQGDVIRALHLVLGAQQAIRTSSQPRLRLELALIQLAVMDATVSLTELLDKIDRMGDAPAGERSAGGPRPAIVTNAARPSEPSSSPAAPIPMMTPGNGTFANGAANDPVAIDEAPPMYAPPRHVSPVEDLASFPTTAPVNPAMHTLASAPAPNGVRTASHSDGIANGNGNGSTNGAGVQGPGIGEVKSRWADFLRFCDDKKTLVHTLQSATPAEIAGGTLRLYIDNDSQRMVLTRNMEVLEQKLREFFHTPLHVEGVIGAPPAVMQSEASPVIPRGDQIDHPFIRGIVEMLGATPLA